MVQLMTDPDVPGPSDPYMREHLHWYTIAYIAYIYTLFDVWLACNIYIYIIESFVYVCNFNILLQDSE